MPLFNYQGLDASGKPTHGQVLSSSEDMAQHLLRQRGLQVQELRLAPDPSGVSASSGPAAATASVAGAAAAPSSPAGTHPVNTVRLVPLHQLAMFFRQSASLLKAGITPFDAYTDLSRRLKHSLTREICAELAAAAHRNEPLQPVFERYPGAFSPFMRAIVAAGERGGFLPESFDQIASYLEAEIELRNKIRIATIYPKLLFAAAIAVMLFLNDISRMVTGKPVYSSPLLQFQTWLVLGPILLGLFVFFRYGTRLEAIKAAWDGIVLYIPWFGSMVRMMAMAKFGRAFGLLYRAGLLPAESMEYAADSCGNAAMRSYLRQSVEPLRKGAGIADTLIATRQFPDVLMQMVATGERTGELDKMLLNVADYFDREAEVRAKQTAVALGILMLLAVVVWIASQIVGVLGGYATQLQEVIAE